MSQLLLGKSRREFARTFAACLALLAVPPLLSRSVSMRGPVRRWFELPGNPGYVIVNGWLLKDEDLAP